MDFVIKAVASDMFAPVRYDIELVWIFKNPVASAF
jgi:hypothetical protein